MSYILDALRRADAERQRESGVRPGLATSLEAGWRPRDAASEGRSWRWAALAALLFAAIGAGLWWAGWRPVAAPPAATRPVPQLPAQPAPVAQAVPTPSPTPPLAPSPPVQVPAPVPVPVPQAQAPVPAVAPAVAAAPARAQPKPRPAVRADATPAPARPTPLAALPPEQRQQLPRLAVGGSMYSQDPALRMVILDGQLLHEGESVAPGLLLERVNPRSAVLRWGDRRVELGW